MIPQTSTPPQPSADDLRDPFDGSPKYNEDGVDVELNRQGLARTPLERLRHHYQWQKSLAWLSRARPVAD